MDLPTMRRRVVDGRVARLATVTPDGMPHLVPCCFAFEADTIYSAVDDVKAKASFALRRLDNVRARPVATVLVDHYDEDWSTLWWVRVDGRARVLDSGEEQERALDLLVVKYEQYAAARPPGPVLAISAESWRAWP